MHMHMRERMAELAKLGIRTMDREVRVM